MADQSAAAGGPGMRRADPRDLVRRSFEIATYESRRDPAVEDAYARLLGLVGR